MFQFGNVAGTTFNRDIYIKSAAANSWTSGNFEWTTRLLLHELEHVQQYSEKGWNLPAFGLSYLFGWCKAGFSYASIPQEVQARQWEVSNLASFEGMAVSTNGPAQSRVDSLLYWPSPGRYFFDIWKKKNLQPALGYPIAQTYSNVAGTPDTMELPFQLGALQVQRTPQLCYRIFSNGELVQRAAAGCQMIPKCKRSAMPKQKDCRPGDDCEPPRPPGHPDPDDVSFDHVPCEALPPGRRR